MIMFFSASTMANCHPESLIGNRQPQIMLSFDAIYNGKSADITRLRLYLKQLRNHANQQSGISKQTRNGKSRALPKRVH